MVVEVNTNATTNFRGERTTYTGIWPVVCCMCAHYSVSTGDIAFILSQRKQSKQIGVSQSCRPRLPVSHHCAGRVGAKNQKNTLSRCAATAAQISIAIFAFDSLLDRAIRCNRTDISASLTFGIFSSLSLTVVV